MDKTFNDLMDIVNRSKKIDGGERPRPRPRPAPAPIEEYEEEYTPVEYDVVEKPKRTRTVNKTNSPDLFGETSAISKMLNKSSKPKTTATKSTSTKSSTAKKTTTAKKSTSTKATATKSTTTKKPTTPKASKVEEVKEETKVVEKVEPKVVENIEPKVEKVEAPKTAPVQNFDYNDSKNAQLYEALKNSLFSGGTDISEYVDTDNSISETRSSLEELKAKREAQKINAEITKEQQEYEQLFTGSLGSVMQDATEEESNEVDIDNAINVAEKNARLESDLNAIRSNLESKKSSVSMPSLNENRQDATYEIETGNRDLDKKIAEYYKRKQEKINEYKAREEEGLLEEKNTQDETPVDYESIFNGSMMSRDELLGIEKEETIEPVESIEPVENEEVVETTEPETIEPQEVETKNTIINNEVVEPIIEETAEPETAETIEESIPTDIEETIEPVETKVEEQEETEDSKEAHIKSLLSDLLFSRKEIEEMNKKSESQSVETQELEESEEVQENIESKDNYENAWTETLTDNRESEELAEDEIGELRLNPNIETEDIEETEETEVEEVEEQETSLTNPFDEKITLSNEVPTSESFEDEENLGIKLEENETKEDIYNLSNKDTDISDYILSSNTPTESVYDEEFETAVNNEKKYYSTKKSYSGEVDDDPEDSTCIVDTLPENKYDILGNDRERIVEQEAVEEENTVSEIDNKDDTISKEEFYNEMARLQENLINQLKGNAVQTESKDFFEEKVQPVQETNNDDNANIVAEELIEKLTNLSQELEEDNEEENIIEEVVEESNQVLEPEISKAEPVDPAKFEEYNLLNKEEPLNEEDLAYQEKSEEEKDSKDSYFYLSPEDNEQKALVNDEYVKLFDEEPANFKEVGDIHFFKNINNATPSSEILKEVNKEVKTESNPDDEVEAIYTLMGIERKPISKPKEDMKVLYVTSECQPFIASGGLGDVAGSLPNAIAKKGGVDIRVIMPLYGNIKNEYRDNFEYLGNFTVHLSWRQEYCGLFRYYKDGVTYYFIDNERYFKRDNLYGYYDDGERFAYFCKAIVEALPHLNFFPDIIHCNDWQSALVSAYIKTGNWSDFRYYKIKNIYTIHNVEYQGVYGMENLKDLFGIDPRFRNDLDYNGDINLTKAAIQYSDKFTTVSNSYCDNLKQPYCSRGLHHIIIRNEYKLSGIINGIDYNFYNPATDTCLFKNYDYACMEEKVLNKKSWQDEMGLPVDGDTPMIAIVSRLVGHKGLDLVTKVMENILQQDIQLVVVGTGDQKYVDYFKYLEDKYPTKVRALVDKYSNENARKAYAASDIFLMPSKIEPCGISQMISSRYGSVPVVREVGGLKDTIKDFGCDEGGNGYTFTNYNPNDLSYQLNRALKDYEDKAGWKEKMKTCMSVDFTWEKPAEQYINLYKSVCDN